MQQKIRRKWAYGSFLVIALCVGLWGQSEWRLRELMQPQARLNARALLPQEKAAFLAQHERLNALWLARNKRDVTPDLLKLLRNNPHINIQTRTIRALGRLEKPSSLRPLQAWTKGLNPEQKAALSPTLPLALGRIQSHNLKGQAKLNTIAKSVGLSWSEIGRLSKKVNAPKSYAQGAPADTIVDEIVDVLYCMGKQGQETEEVVRQLHLTTTQQVFVGLGKLNKGQEIRAILDYCHRIKVLGSDESKMSREHLLSLGEEAKTTVYQHMGDMLKNPAKYPDMTGYGTGHSAILRIVSPTKDQRFIPLLIRFEKMYEADYRKKPNSSGGWIYASATQSRRYLESKGQVLMYP